MASANSLPPHGPDDEPLPVVVPVEDTPLTVVAVEEPPPHPGFWMAVLWAAAFFLVMNGAALIALVAIMFVQAVGAANPDAFLQRLIGKSADGTPVVTPELGQMLAPAVLFGQVVSILFAWLIVRKIVGRDWQRQLALRPPSPVHLLLLLAGMPGFLILPEAIAELARMVLPSMQYQKDLNDLFRHWHWLYGVLGIGLGAGIGEELWCRGFLGRGLVGRYGVGWGIVLTSMLFGLMHLDPPHAVATAFMGAALHFVYLSTRSLVAPMVVHALNNSAGFLLISLGENYPAVKTFLKDFEQVSLLGAIPLYASSALLLAAVGWALYRSRVVVVPEHGAGPNPWRPPYPGVAEPPPGSGAELARHRLDGVAVGAVLAALVFFAATLWWASKQTRKTAERSPRAAVGVCWIALSEPNDWRYRKGETFSC